MRQTLATRVGIGLAVVALTAASCAQQGQAQWKVHHDPAGFDVSFPDGWTASGSKDGHVLILNKDRSAFAMVLPFKVDPNAKESIGQLIHRVDGQQFPNVQVGETRQISTDPNEEMAKITFAGRGTTIQGNVLCVRFQGVGMLYAIGAPTQVFDADKAPLVAVLRSFQYTGTGSTPSASGGGALAFENWTEPNENQFTTQVPVGWHVFGGSYRFAPIDIRRQMVLVSPDGQIHVENGYAQMSALVGEGPSSRIRGLHQGQFYQANGVTYTVLNYVEGPEFSRRYTMTKIKKDLPDLQVTGTKERPDLEEFVNSKMQQSGIASHASVGETDFTFTDHGSARQGGCIVTTVPIGPNGPGMLWQAYPSYVTAPAEKMDTAWKVWAELITKSVDNPDWVAKQSQITQEFNAMVVRNFQAAMQQIHEQYEKATHQLDENFRGMDNVINGTVDVRDAQSGQTFNVVAGHNYYWRNGSTVVGTNTYNPPDINFTPLAQF